MLAVALHGAYDFCVFVQMPLHFEGYEWTAKLVMPTLVGLTLLAFLVVRAMARTALRLDDADAALAMRPAP